MKSLFFILLSFFSSVGDSVFLTGIPLFLFHSNGDSLVSANYVAAAIAVAVLATRGWSEKLPHVTPLLTVGLGECAMAALELVIAGAYWATGEKWLVLVGVLPLAFIYNLYAPYKFFRIQDCVAKREVFQFSTWVAAAQRLGFLAGVAASGWLLTRHGAVGIILFDAASFATYGLATLWIYHRSRHAGAASSVPAQKSTSTVAPSLRGLRFGGTALALLTVASLLGSWEQGNAIAVATQTLGESIDRMAAARATYSGVGIAAALILSHFLPAWSFVAWIGAMAALLAGSPLLSLTHPGAAVSLMFFVGGAASCLRIPVAREIYHMAEQERVDGRSMMPRHWICNAMLNFALPFVALLAQSAASTARPPLFWAVLGVAILGTCGGIAVSRWLLASMSPLPRTIAVAAMLLLFGGCTKRPEGPYRTALLGKAPTFDPIALEGYNSLTLVSQICGRLTSVDPALNIEGDLASSWNISPDRRTITFNLRSDRHFADGSPVSIDDVLFTIQRTRQRNSLAATWTQEIDRIALLPPDRVQIVLKRPNPRLLYILSQPSFCILNRARPFISVSGTPVPNSSGAYRVKALRPGVVDLVVSDDFRRRAVESHIEVRFLDQVSALRAFAEGSLHDLSFYLLDDGEIDALGGKVQITSTKMYWTWIVALNPHSTLFRSPEDRSRFLGRLDRERVALDWGATLEVSGAMIPKGMIGHSEPASRDKVRGAGFPCERPITAFGIAGLPREQALARALTHEIREKTGCELRVQFLDMERWPQVRAKRDADLYIFGMDTNSTDQLGFFREFISGESENSLGYSDPALDQKYRHLYSKLPLERDAADYAKLQDIFDRAAFAWLLGHPTFKFAYAPSVSQIQMNSLGMQLNRWWQIGRGTER
jgi:MarR-like DNA-binding transcriptional regulator SgrR of sgrS sRNA